MEVLIVYSTQSGTSEDLSFRFSRKVSACKVVNTSQIQDLDDLKGFPIVVFFISSYGDGEPCDDGIRFIQMLKDEKKLHIKYSLFGCGNSLYDDYQGAAHQFKKLMDGLGGDLVGDVGYSDEAFNGVVDDFESWSFDYLNLLSDMGIKLNRSNGYREAYQITEVSEMPKQQSRPPYHEMNPFYARITNIVRNKDQYMHFEVELDSVHSRMKYQSGDHIGIYPVNDGEIVDELMVILGIVDCGSVRVMPVNRMESCKWNRVYSSIRELLMGHVEISGVLSRKFVKDLTDYFITSESTKRRLQELIRSRDVFRREVVERKLTIVRFFKEFDLSKNDYTSIPLSFILETFGHIKPRYYSITSSECVEKDRVGVMIKLVKDKPNNFVGQCSQTIMLAKSDTALGVFIRRSKFKLPYDLSRPLIFVGAGTGVAPFRGFLMEIVSAKYKLDQITRVVMYLGFRTASACHYLYADDFARYKELLGDRLSIRIAESQVTGKYVQDLLVEDTNLVKRLVENGGCVYVCGDKAGLALGVRRALGQILGGSSTHSLEYLAAVGRFKEDVW